MDVLLALPWLLLFGLFGLAVFAWLRSTHARDVARTEAQEPNGGTF